METFYFQKPRLLTLSSNTRENKIRWYIGQTQSPCFGLHRQILLHLDADNAGNEWEEKAHGVKRNSSTYPP